MERVQKKVFSIFISNEDIGDIIKNYKFKIINFFVIKVVRSLEVLSDGVIETVKHEGRFLSALLAPLARSGSSAGSFQLQT